MMSCLILHTNSGARAALRAERLRRSTALACALNQMYLPDGVLLRFNSRESVDWLIPTICAISFLGHFTRGVFHGLETLKKRMICCTSILKVRSLFGWPRII